MRDESLIPPEPFLRRLLRHAADLWPLAWPVMLSRAGILVMAFVDIAMLGRYAPGAMGQANLGVQIFVPGLVIAIGLASGVMPIVAHAFGARNYRECGHAWRRAMIWAALVGAIGSAFCWQGEAILTAIGQEPDLAKAGGDVARMLAPGLIAQTLYACSAFYLEATRRPMPGLVVMIGANILNGLLNWIMIWGNLGFPELGPSGAALASTLVRIGSAVAMIAYILTRPDARLFGVLDPWETTWGPGGWRAGWPMRRLGISAGLSNGAETLGFAAMSMMAGWLGALSLDAYAISHNVVSTVFMVGLGLAIATGVRVGNEAGAGNREEAVFAAWAGMIVTAAVMGTIALCLILFGGGLAAVYTDDPAIQARAAMLFAVAALVVVPDASQVVMGQALRALGDAWIAIGAYFLAFVVVMVPLGHFLVFGLDWDERGLIVAIAICCCLAVLMLVARFVSVTRGWR